MKNVKSIKLRKTRNEHKRSLYTTASNAAQPIAINTRPQAINNKKGKGSYKRHLCQIN